MGKWICKECGVEVFEVTTKGREIISKLNKNGVAIEVVHKDKTETEISTMYRCDGCGIEDFSIENMAEWEEE